MAVYGDFDRITSFKEKSGTGFRNVPNHDVIRAGQILYHPDPLPGEKAPSTTPAPVPPEQTGQIQSTYVAQFHEWVMRTFVRCDWAVMGNGGGDLSLSFFNRAVGDTEDGSHAGHGECVVSRPGGRIDLMLPCPAG
ncbi:MAG: hypothetical protein JNL62_12910 [Bryobacterales bacterium]|nr:hypothetical protein [Bryobacterales bacterium]